MPKTFAQYLVDKCLPAGMGIVRQVDDAYLAQLLSDVATRYPDRYDEVVSSLKRLGDKLSTYEPLTIGLDELSVPNRNKRDAIIRAHQNELQEDIKAGRDPIPGLERLQHELAANDLDGRTDDASQMVRSGLKSGVTQLMKIRTSPGVVADHNGNIVPEIWPKSYAEGVDPLHFWLGATESRRNIAMGQVATAAPGEMSKVISAVLAPAVVSREDCGTERGILLGVRDEDIIDRYLARAEGKFKAGTLVTADVQQEMLRNGMDRVLVRSPETCMAPGGSVCQKCMGLRPGTGKPYRIGDNAGLITAGSLGEPLTQMSLAAKHSTTMATSEKKLTGEKGFRQIVESPSNYPHRKVLCEVMGEVQYVRPAPQGGKIITIRQTQPVPDRYIELARPTPDRKGYWDYHVPQNLEVLKHIKPGLKVYPGMELSSGVDNLRDIARLRNLGYLRSSATQNMYDVYRNTGNKLDRRHFELLARNAHPYVRVLKAPAGFPYSPGESIAYSELERAVSSMPKTEVSLDSALGGVLAEGVLNMTVGTEIDAPAQAYLKQGGIKKVKTVQGLEIAADELPLTRVPQQGEDWIAGLNTRYLRQQIGEAAMYGKKSDIHGYNPIPAYAYGVELGNSGEGKY